MKAIKPERLKAYKAWYESKRKLGDKPSNSQDSPERDYDLPVDFKTPPSELQNQDIKQELVRLWTSTTGPFVYHTEMALHRKYRNDPVKLKQALTRGNLLQDRMKQRIAMLEEELGRREKGPPPIYTPVGGQPPERKGRRARERR